MPVDPLISCRAVSRRLGRTPQTVKRWAARVPDFPRPIRIGARVWFSSADLESWLARRKGAETLDSDAPASRVQVIAPARKAAPVSPIDRDAEPAMVLK